MKEVIKIVAPKGALYVSEFMSDFPNGILNKKECGVGNTHLAIINPENYIIAVPTIELIENKCFQHPHLIGVFGNMQSNEFYYLLDKQESPKKIMVTYNSIPKLVRWLKAKGNPYQDYKLMIDEYHSVLGDYSFKKTVINDLLDEALLFDHKTFVSATPITPKYVPNELQGLDNYEIEWQDTIKIKPFRHKTNKPFLAAVNIIKQYKAAEYRLPVKVEDEIFVSHEALFFVNSVTAIVDIIDNAGLSQKEVKIICADNEENRTKLGDLEIGKVSDPNKPFTFVTSKSFLGSDFYSESAITYVVSSCAKQNTLYSISSDVFQIAGRIRTKTNPFKNYIYHIYNTSASDMTREEFEKSVIKKKKYSYDRIEAYNLMPVHLKEANRALYEKEVEDSYNYFNKKTDTLEYNHLKELNEDFKFSIVYETYTDGLAIRDAYLKAGFDVTTSQLYTNNLEDFIAKATSMNFKETLKEYCDLVDCRICAECFPDEERIKHLCLLEPSIVDIVKKLGTDKCRALGYIKKSINQLLYNGTQEVNNAIKIELKAKYNSNVAYSSNDVKAFLQELYDKLKLNKKAKATDLAEYLQIDKKKRLLNGKVQDSIVITSEIILNSKATEMYNLLDIPEKPVDNVLDYLDLD